MNKSAKYFILTELVLGILVAVLAALMLKGQNKDTLGRVAVIVRDSDDSQWSAFKYGIRMAAQERGVEAVIIGTERVLTLEDQEELIQAELENGVDAFRSCWWQIRFRRMERPPRFLSRSQIPARWGPRWRKSSLRISGGI